MDQLNSENESFVFTLPTYAYFATVMIILLIIRWREHIQNYFRKRAKLIKFAEKLPGPPLKPIVGNALELQNPDATLMTLTEMQRKLNVSTYRLWLGPYLKIVVTDPRDIEILMQSPKASEKDNIYDYSTRPAAQNSLINSAGAFYRNHKKIIMPLIGGQNFLPHYMKEFNKQSRIMVGYLNERNDNEEQDVQEHCVGPCVSDIVMETVFGTTGRAQTGGDTEFMDKTESTLDAIWSRAICIWLWPTIIFKMTECGKLFFTHVRIAHDFFDDLILRKKHDLSMKEKTDSKECKVSLTDSLIKQVANTWTQREIRDELMTLWIASFDTVSGIASFVLLMLAMNPDIQGKLREEIETVAGDDDIDEKKATDLKYLDMIIRETIRLFPAGPVLARKITGDIKLTNCTLPEGCSALMLPFATARDPRYWIEPETFNPERFEQENAKSRHPFTTVPFSGGIRSCPGSKFAMNCMKVLVSHVIRDFSLTTSMKMEDIKLHMHISTRSGDGYPVTFKKLIK